MVKKKSKKSVKNVADTKNKNTQKSVKTSEQLKSKLILIGISTVLILVVMFFAFYFRSGSINLNSLEDRVEANTYSQIKSLITQEVSQQYPNLNDFNKNEIIEEKYKNVIETGVYSFNGQEIKIDEIILQNQEYIKSAFKAENNQTYLTAIDPYYYLRISENVFERGNIGDTTIDGVSYNNKQLAPRQLEVNNNYDFHTWLESKLYKLNGLDENSTVGEKTKAVYLIPVIFAILAIIPIFLILNKFTNPLFSFFGALLLITIGTFVSRTVAGFVDTDAYNVFFPLLILMFLIYGFTVKNKVLTILFSFLAGISQILYLWAWGKGWFIFVFVIFALVGYFGYLLVVQLLNKYLKNKEKIDSKMFVNSLLTLISFVITTYVFNWIFFKRDIFVSTYNSIFGSISGIAGISGINIWPNVLSSVAELNPASYGQIISAVGGKFVFFISLLGLLFLSLDFKSKNEQFKLLQRILGIIGIFWLGFFAFTNLFTFLTANYVYVFILLMFLPIGFGLLLGLFNQEISNKIFLTILLSTWIGGTIYMSLNGVRFVLLLAPAFAIGFGFGLYYLSKFINTFFTKEFEIKKGFGRYATGFVLTTILFVILFIPMANQANAISKNTTPNFDDAWYEAMYKIKNESNDDAIITSWWDFGHFFAAIGDRGVTFDGASQTTPQSHWVGKLLLENDEKISHDILKMLVCGGNNAFDKFYEFVGKDNSDAVKINKILYSTFGKENKQEILENNKYYDLTDEQIKIIMDNLACEEPVEDFLITSEDMVSKAGAWAHWGNWDFTKKYVHDNYKKLNAEEMANNVDENSTLIEKYVNELNNIDKKAIEEDIKRENLINQWFADYPSYVPIQNQYVYPCNQNNQSIICQNGLSVDVLTGKAEFLADPSIKFKNIIVPGLNNTLNIYENDVNGTFDAVFIPTGTGFNSLIAQSPLGGSLFTKLFYLDGYGTEYFEKFDDKQSVTGVRIKVWKAIWEKKDLEENNSFESNLENSSIEE